MPTTSLLKPDAADHGLKLRRLRWQLYNATLEAVRRVHDDLGVFRVRGDGAMPAVQPGQYTLLGLGSWESNAEPAPDRATLIRRAYSVSCGVIDEGGQLLPLGHGGVLEFYIARVAPAGGARTSFTPLLFALGEGDRLFLGKHAKGRYTLAPVRPDDDVIFCATGTGEAPHNAMIVELLSSGHRGRIVSAVTVRHERDLAYERQHRALERRFPRYRYVPLTTREPRNVDAMRSDYAGRRYLQDVFATDATCREAIGFAPRPGAAHFFLCGNPAMIGLPRRQADGSVRFPEMRGMAETLAARGFRLDEPKTPGDVHFEKYW